MPDDHSEVVPLLPIPNRTVKRLRADDSAHSRVKVGHRQAPNAIRPIIRLGVFFRIFLRVLKKTCKNGVIIQGFADRSEARASDVKSCLLDH